MTAPIGGGANTWRLQSVTAPISDSSKLTATAPATPTNAPLLLPELAEAPRRPRRESRKTPSRAEARVAINNPESPILKLRQWLRSLILLDSHCHFFPQARVRFPAQAYYYILIFWLPREWVMMQSCLEVKLQKIILFGNISQLHIMILRKAERRMRFECFVTKTSVVAALPEQLHISWRVLSWAKIKQE